MTTSPTFTSSGTRLPLSSMRPGPTAMTVPSWGFSLAVSGMTRPEAVVVSASLAWTTTRSSSGLMLTLVAVVTSVTPPSVSDGLGMGDGAVVLMLWHGIRAPAVAGVGRQPVSIGTLPTRVPAAQPGPPTTYSGRAAGWQRARRRARPAPLAAYLRRHTCGPAGRPAPGRRTRTVARARATPRGGRRRPRRAGLGA